MRLERYTVKTRQALEAAQGEARGRDHQQIGTLHLLAALIEQSGGVTRPLLQRLGVDTGTVASSVEGELEKVPQVRGAAGQVYLGQDLAKALEGAEKEAARLKDDYVSAEH
ncbi:MAG: Clp protease N-terminal domain-containing protein, partial [Planctomycetota bacterium]